MRGSDVSTTCVVTGVGPPDDAVARCFEAATVLLIAVEPVVLHSADGKGGYTLVKLPRIVTPYRDSADGTHGRVTYQKLVTR